MQPQDRAIKFPAPTELLRVWADYLFDPVNQEQLAHVVSMWSPEPWLVLECSWATKRQWAELGLGGWLMLIDRHLPELSSGDKADLSFVPYANRSLDSRGDDAPVFEFKVCWADSLKDVDGAVSGVSHDINTRGNLPTAFSVVFAFAFEWYAKRPHPWFRRQPRRDHAPWTEALDYLRKQLTKRRLDLLSERESSHYCTDNTEFQRVHFWLAMLKHPR